MVTSKLLLSIGIALFFGDLLEQLLQPIFRAIEFFAEMLGVILLVHQVLAQSMIFLA